MLILLFGFGSTASAGEFDKPLKAIQSVGKEGAGNAEARLAWTELVRAGRPALFPILGSMKEDNPTSLNWFRTAVEAIAEKAASEGHKLEIGKLIAFITDRKNGPSARTVAFEVLRSADPAKAATLVPGFITDTSLELRREAVQQGLAQAPTLGRPIEVSLAMLFEAARDKDQVETIAKAMELVKMPADITKHFGYITQWSLSEAFDNTAGVGYAKAYPPEAASEYKTWALAQSAATYGTLDLNTAIAKKQNVAAYASAVLVADSETAAEIRVASQNAVKIFFNGKEVFAREEYHHGTRMDQHTAKVALAKGQNTVMIKICQNDMPYEWAQVWGFSTRICDNTGGALPLKQLIGDKLVSLGELAPKESK